MPSLIRIATVTLLIPALLLFLALWRWRPGALVMAFVLLIAAGGLAHGVMARLRHRGYRFAVAAALTGVFLLVWINAAVGGILGDDPANMMYFGVLLIGGCGAALGQLEPAGMSQALWSMAYALVLVPAIAWLIRTPAFANGVPAVFGLHALLALPFAASAWWFRRIGSGATERPNVGASTGCGGGLGPSDPNLRCDR